MTEQNSPEWQPPPPPENVVADPPQMSGAAALGNVFIEPGKVFDDMRRKPRFLLAGLLIVLIFSIFQAIFIEKIGLENIVRARIESSRRTQDLPSDQKETIIKQQGGPIAKYATYAITPVIGCIILLIGGLLYWGLSNAMGGSNSFTGGLSVWAYAGFPPAVFFFAGNLIVLFLKSVEDIDLAHSQGGLLKASLGFFIDANSSPVLAAFLGSFDLFTIWGWILASIGLQRVAKVSSGAAWAVVLIVGAIGVAIKTIPAFF
jgi:Yip1 domain